MIKENLIDVIIDCINKNDYSTIISRVSYEERFNFFNGGKLINDNGNNLFAYFGNKGIFENLFTEIEAKNLMNSYFDEKSRYILILNLSDEEKVKHISEVLGNQNYVIGTYPYPQKISANKFFSAFKDKEFMNKVICEKYELFSNLSKSEIISFVEILDNDYKMQLFNNIVKDQLEGKKKIIENYNVTSIINCFPEEQKEEVLDILLTIPEKIEIKDNNKTENLTGTIKDLERMLDEFLNDFPEKNKKSNNTKKGIIDKFSISSILDCFEYKNKKHILEKLYKYFKEQAQEIHISTYEIKKHFKLEDLKDIIKLFIDVYSGDNGIYKYEVEMKDYCVDYASTQTIINMTFDLEKETGIKLLSEYTLNRLIENLSFEEKLSIINKHILEEKKMDIEKFILTINNIELKYSILEYLLEKGYLKENTFETIKLYIQERNNELFADGSIIYPIINKLYCERYKLNEENFSLMIKKYGYIIINYLDNQNIIDIINMPKEDFIKYIKIFDNNILTNDDINNVCNALLQREFRLKNKEDYNIFSTIERIISSGSDNSREELINIINKINETIDIEKHLKKYKLSINEFIELLLINNTNSINILHEITNKYIALKREKYVNEQLVNINEELYLEKKLEKQFYKKTYINQINENNIIYDIRYRINRNTLDEKEQKFINNSELLSKIIKFKKYPNNIQLSPEEKVSLKIFEKLLNMLCEEQIRKNELKTEEPKYSYYIFESTNEEILNIMANINVDNIQKNVLSNNILYENLIDIMGKYHFIGWHKTFTKLAERADISLSDGTIAGLISYFNEIYPKINTNSNYLTSILDYGNLYDYSSLRYKYLLGKEDFTLIAANEGKNKASMTKHKRLENSVSFVKKMYERKYTTVPPIDKDFTISNGKKINVVVGNSTNMINLTCGERTESCLRIGGAFADLFDFCISDENGFHIRFTNPNTGKFVSRVSGIRNGNTLFLNELRESVDDTYNNEELIESLREVSNELINLSKNSDFPIENVIITSDYALKSHEIEEKTLGLNKEHSALYNLHFNIKVEEDKGIILMTSAEDNSLKTYNFSRNNITKYECQRDKIKVFYNNEAKSRMIQLHIIDRLLSGNELENIEIDLNINCDFCISGEDWYIAKTSDNQIIQYIMLNSKNKEKALEELNIYLEQMQNQTDKKSDIRRR